MAEQGMNDSGTPIDILKLLADSDGHGNTLLHLAAQMGDEPRVREILESGTQVDVSSSEGQTPLMLAAFQGHPKVVQLLLAHGASVGASDKLGLTPLHWAATAMPMTIEVDGAEGYRLANRDRQDWIQVVEMLLANGADTSAQALKGQTPLYLALRTGNAEIAELLKSRAGTQRIGCTAMPVVLLIRLLAALMHR